MKSIEAIKSILLKINYLVTTYVQLIRLANVPKLLFFSKWRSYHNIIIWACSIIYLFMKTMLASQINCTCVVNR